MNRLSDKDWNCGPVTVGTWHRSFSITLNSGDDESPESYLLATGFGRAIRLRVWGWLCRPWREKWVECGWDAETVKRLGRSGYWKIHRRRFGFSLSDMGNGYDFLQVFFGPSTNDSSTSLEWAAYLPWKEWSCVRRSLYAPDGSHFYTESKEDGFLEFLNKKAECPKSRFGFKDYDGEIILATCTIEEREWRRGAGWFRWLRRLVAPRVVRSLDLDFSNEVGPGKGSWKGGTVGHGIDMLPGETPEDAFRRYCKMPHKHRGNEFRLQFIDQTERDMSGTGCTYTPSSGKPCPKCPRQISALHKCGFLREGAGEFIRTLVTGQRSN